MTVTGASPQNRHTSLHWNLVPGQGIICTSAGTLAGGEEVGDGVVKEAAGVVVAERARRALLAVLSRCSLTASASREVHAPGAPGFSWVACLPDSVLPSSPT